MWWLYAKIHDVVFWAARKLSELVGRSLGRFLLAVWLLINEEVRRYIGLAVWGAVFVLFGKAILNYIPADVRLSLVLVDLGLLCIWAFAVKRAIRMTRRNSLVRQEQRKAFRDLSAEVKGARRDWTEGLARATRNTPVRKVFRSNREDIAKAEEQARQAEAEAEARAAHAAYLESLPPDHDPFATQGSR